MEHPGVSRGEDSLQTAEKPRRRLLSLTNGIFREKVMIRE